jgi:hypothetical protein
MTVVARKVASIPVRLASATWERIVDLIAPTNRASRTELLSVIGVASSLITREAMRESPIIVAGEGPRLRFYCVYGEDAVEGEKVSEAALPASPAESDTWTVSLPCPADDLSWVQSSLKEHSSRITARDQEETSLPEQDAGASADATVATINVESFLRT